MEPTTVCDKLQDFEEHEFCFECGEFIGMGTDRVQCFECEVNELKEVIVDRNRTIMRLEEMIK